MPLSSIRSARLIAGRLRGHAGLEVRRRELTHFVETFESQATEDTYNKWLRNPVTQKVLALLDEASFLPSGFSAALETGDTGIDYGITLGMQFATRFMRNPAMFLPVFEAPEDGAEQEQTTQNDAAYTDPPEAALN